jgi:hypothetical protein
VLLFSFSLRQFDAETKKKLWWCPKL